MKRSAIGGREWTKGGTNLLTLLTMCGAVLLLTGCYQYSPISFDAIVPSLEIRATLTSEKTLEVEQFLGSLQPQLEGEVLEHSGRALLVGVPQLSAGSYRGSGSRMRQRFWFEEPDLIRLEARTLDHRRTGMLVGAVGTVLGYALYRALGAGAVDTDRPPDSGNGGVYPFRLPFPWLFSLGNSSFVLSFDDS